MTTRTVASNAAASHPAKKKELPVVTIFTSIANIAPALCDSTVRIRSDPTDGGTSTSTLTTSTSTLTTSTTTLLPCQVMDDPAALSGYGGTVEFDPSKLSEQSIRQLQQAEILLTEPHVLAALLDHYQGPAAILPKLQWCQSTYAGVNPIFQCQQAQAQPQKLDFTLTRFAGVFGPPIAEWCLGRMLEYERDFVASRRDQAVQGWAACAATSRKLLHYRYLSDCTLTILGGAGDIGQALARAAKYGFGMRVVGFGRRERRDITATTSNLALDEYTTNLSHALQQADFVVSVLPSTPATAGLLTLATFQEAFGHRSTTSASAQTHAQNAPREPPVWINVGRGDVVDHDNTTLVQALDRGYLAAAILDVFATEPLPASSPLWTHPRVTVSPHVSGLTRARDVPALVVDQYERYVHSQTLRYVVDWEKGY